ncbi:GNAT family N-acetyltransferase [Winogradskyella sp.]|uniref:GNAT family N-acetyltransferase n=1 Tax=Winogradskyella sp. TaxID=1883156 RepID=UPI003BAC3892
MKIDILKKQQLSPRVQKQISELFKQLGGDKTQVALNDVIDGNNQITLAYCEVHNEIIGMALMCHYNVISGKKAWIEDVVVNAAYRGQGIGRKLMTKLIASAKEKNISQILLFTEDHRASAIHLYSDLGFRVKASRIYTLAL